MTNKFSLGDKMLRERYYYGQEKTYEDLVDRMLSVLPADQERRKTILKEGFLKRHIVPATPNLTNLGTRNPNKDGKARGLPISCFVSEFDDNIENIISTLAHNSILSAYGGGVGTDISSVREVGATINNNGKTGGIFPFLNIQASGSLGISQGGTRGGAAVVNIDIDHPEIEEFIRFRLAEDGSAKDRKFPRLNHTVKISDKFMTAVLEDKPFDLISRVDGTPVKTVSAFDLFMDLLEVRFRRGEPNIIFSDNTRKNRSFIYDQLNKKSDNSNLCVEVLLETSPDMTSVCCLGSINLEFWDEVQDNYELVEAFMYFLDCSLNETVHQINLIEDPVARLSMQRVVKFIENDHSIGLGVMGYHTYLQQKGIPMESALAVSATHSIFNTIKKHVDTANEALGRELGSCELAKEAGVVARFSNCTAIAPTASISYIAGGVSPGIDPILSNYFSIGNEEGYSSWRNPELEKIIRSYAGDLMERGEITSEAAFSNWIDEQWSSILSHEGSVQHLEWMDEWHRDVFKTAYEIDQEWIIELAAARQLYIDQAQSTNLFFAHDTHVRKLFNTHVKAWHQDVKTLYYCRTRAAARADDSGNRTSARKEKTEAENFDYNDCLACQ